MESGEVVIPIVIVGLAALAWWLGPQREATEERSRFARLLPCSAPECVEGASTHMVRAGYAIVHKSNTSATYTRPKKPSSDIGCLLLLLGIIPGLLYLGLYKGVYTTSLVASTENGGTRLIVSGDDREGRQILAFWVEDY